MPTIGAKVLFRIEQNEVKISRTDFFNKTCDSFFKWFKTDEQLVHLGNAIAEHLLANEDELFKKQLRFDFFISDISHSLFLIAERKSNIFIDIKLLNFLKTSKIPDALGAEKNITLKTYTYFYKLIVRDADHFECNYTFNHLRCKLYYSSHLKHSKEALLKKYNFNRLMSDVVHYAIQNNMIETIQDGTPLHIKALPAKSSDDDTVNHVLYVTCSVSLNSNSDKQTHLLLMDNIRYTPSTNKDKIKHPGEVFVGHSFTLDLAKKISVDPKSAKKLKIVKKIDKKEDK